MSSTETDTPRHAGAAPPRAIRVRTRGHAMGPITRLVSPQNLGEILKPFVFLDLADLPPGPAGAMRWHPHSGIATLTIVLEGENAYQETTGVRGGLKAGGLEWMASGRGVWHTASAVGTRNLKGFQVWLLLPPGADLQPPASTYLDGSDVPGRDGIRVILGTWDGLASRIAAPPRTTLLDVALAPGARWTFTPPEDQTLCWLAVHDGAIRYGDEIARAGDLLIFEDGATPLDFAAEGSAGFLLGAAQRAPYPLHVGRHSVHVSAEALRQGEAEIARLGTELVAKGILR